VDHYLTFLLFALVVAVAPGPDSLLTLRTTVVGGRTRGLWTMLGIGVAGALQGVLAATGLGALIVHAEPVFQTIRWLGIVYLTFLGAMAVRSALRASADDWLGVAGSAVRVRRWSALRTGFLCNVSNPKVLAFNLAVLPQFADADSSLGVLLAYALTLAAVGSGVLLVLVLLAGRARTLLSRRRARRVVDGATGVVMLGFATALAVEA
jgi:threonine/homoserine/homoserine lactone efflux protein